MANGVTLPSTSDFTENLDNTRFSGFQLNIVRDKHQGLG